MHTVLDRVKMSQALDIFSPHLLFILAYYAVCSSFLLFVNKVTVYFISAPSFVLFIQLGFTGLFVQTCHTAGVVKAEALSWREIAKFSLVVCCVLGTIFANMKVLQYTNVETFITFRSSTPIILSVCDYVFLGRDWPSFRSWLCLVCILIGCIGYVSFDSYFRIDAYIWVAVWYMFFLLDVVYVKYVCETVKLSNWSRVFYTNSLAAIPLFVGIFVLWEVPIVAKTNMNGWVPLAISCVLAVGMSHSSYVLRDKVSATFFTVIGIICKLGTVLVNWLLWTSHAEWRAMTCLIICIFAGALYQQAPMRADKVSAAQLTSPRHSKLVKMPSAPPEDTA